MSSDYFKCPRCGTRAPKKKIIANNYSCCNIKCELNIRLMVHGEITNTGKISKLYGWVLQPGSLLAKKYKIAKMIGKGGFGATYLARDKSMFDQLRAIKEIPRQYCDDKEDEFLTFLNHPAIPKLYERFNAGKFHYSVMEFIEGNSLNDKVRLNSKGLSETEVLKLAEQLFDVLKYIHSQNVVHRDLKPDNVLIRRDGNISLIDFGIAKRFRNGFGTRYLARAASNFYSSPEQYRTGKGFTDFQSDVYSIGAILYYLATGVEPTDALSRTQGKDITPLPRSLNPQLSEKLESVIVRAMKMNKGERFKTIDEMKKTLFSNGKTTSSKVCPKCQAIINAGDRFCRNCGSATHPIAHDSTSSFVFRSQKKANNIKQLAQICYQDWDEAVQHLYNGDFEAWLKSFKDGKELVERAAAIKKNQPNKHLGLNEFLMNTGYGIAPQLTIQPTAINVDKLPKGTRQEIILSIANSGQGYLNGVIASHSKWIKLTQKSFACLNQATAQLILNIESKLLNANTLYRTKIELRTNAGNITIPVSVSVAKGVSQPKSSSQPKRKTSRAGSFFKSIFLFLAIALLIRHLGPTASLSIAQPWVIILMGALMIMINLRSGLLHILLGGVIGACLGAMMNMIAFFAYSGINQFIITPTLKALTSSYTVRMSYAGWGMIGIYLGGALALFRKKGS